MDLDAAVVQFAQWKSKSRASAVSTPSADSLYFDARGARIPPQPAFEVGVDCVAKFVDTHKLA